MIMKI